ncbi:MAG: hypothetical protein KC646_06520 [Candidatus Cloacimonetes bacterium]|nr:hypothetical protein [Candidatus Cloacimonadota bacterium]
MSGKHSHSFIPKPSKKILLSISLAYLILLFLRNPKLFIYPRFWAEEGSVYFQTAYNEGFFNALFQVQMGYFSIIPNLGSALASLPPLHYAPFVTLLLSLIVQWINIALIHNNSHPFWGLSHNKLILYLILIFLPFNEEVFLNTICSQFHLQISVFLMIYLYQGQKPSSSHILVYALAFLSGGVGIITFAIFCIFIKRENYKKFKAVYYAFALGFVIQAFFYCISHTPRLYSFDLKYYLQILVSKHILGPSFGYQLEPLYYGIRTIKNFLIESNFSALSNIVKIDYLKVLLTTSGAITLFLAVKQFYKQASILLPSLVLSIVFVFLSLKNGSDSFLSFHGGGRYFFASNFILYMGIYESTIKISSLNIWFKKIILLWYIIIGSYSYFQHPEILIPKTPMQHQLHKRVIQLAPSNFVLQINPVL